jgi:hypothetical protein
VITFLDGVEGGGCRYINTLWCEARMYVVLGHSVSVVVTVIIPGNGQSGPLLRYSTCFESPRSSLHLSSILSIL